MEYYDSMHYYPAPRPFRARYEYLEAIAQQSNIHRDYLYNHFGKNLPIMIFNMALDARDWTEMYRMVHEYKADINTPSRYGSPPIWHEVSCGRFDAVQQLILIGARLDIVNHDTQQSLLDIACIKNFNRTKHLLMAYNTKHYKAMYAKQLAVITEPPQAASTETETETKTSK